MIDFYFYKAGCGDAARITFLGDDGKQHHIFIDSGYERTFRDNIRHDVDTIIASNEVIDLWILTHIHDDHIGGVINYVYSVTANSRDYIVKAWLYNSPRVTRKSIIKKTASKPASIGQGDLLTSYLTEKGQIPEPTISGRVININGLNITVLSPNVDQLNKLVNKYTTPSVRTERSEYSTGSIAVAATHHDYHVSADDYDLSHWTEDTNVENGSSIAMLTEFKQTKVLWLADAYPSVVYQNLTILGYSTQNQLDCELVKVSHHGSAGNNSDQLYSLIKCQRYIMSVDGTNTHGLPTKECMLRILKNPYRDYSLKYIFYFTYDHPALRSIFSVDGESIFTKLNFEVIYLNQGKYIPFIYKL